MAAPSSPRTPLPPPRARAPPARARGLRRAICFTTYMMSAFFGYLTFVSYTESNLILNFPVEKSYIVLMARA